MHTNYIIYADILFLLNFFFDFFILWAAGSFLRRKIIYWRLFLAALLGAFYGVGMLIPALGYLYVFGAKIAFSLIIIAIAYPIANIRGFLSLTGFFFLISFAMAGAALGASSLLSQVGFSPGKLEIIGWSSLLFALFIGAILGKKGLKRLRQSWHRDDFKVKLEIRAAGRSCIIPALIDTGNNLLDPVSGRPVIVGEYPLLVKLLPFGIRSAIEKYGLNDPTKIISNQGNSGWENRLRLVPFISIGQSHGLLLGFWPDEIIIRTGREVHSTNKAIICFYNKKLGQGDNYQAVINPDILYNRDENKEVSA